MERTRVVRFRQGDSLRCDFRGPESVGRPGLRGAFFREVGVGPGDGGVAVLLGPVALVCGSVSFFFSPLGCLSSTLGEKGGKRTSQAGVP